MEAEMKVAKWGNSLALRLPASVVEALELKEGDDVNVHIADKRTVEVERNISPDEWMERLRALRGMIPADFKFDRDEANER